jgi:hypothetical protein
MYRDVKMCIALQKFVVVFDSVFLQLMFANGCQYKSSICTVTKFVNSRQGEISTSVFVGFKSETSDTSVDSVSWI